MTQRVSETLNSLANWIIDYSHTAASKVVVSCGVTSAGAVISSNWVDATYQLFAEFPLLNILSGISIILLIIETSFRIWANWRKNKRGEW